VPAVNAVHLQIDPPSAALRLTALRPSERAASVKPFAGSAVRVAGTPAQIRSDASAMQVSPPPATADKSHIRAGASRLGGLPRDSSPVVP